MYLKTVTLSWTEYANVHFQAYFLLDSVYYVT